MRKAGGIPVTWSGLPERVFIKSTEKSWTVGMDEMGLHLGSLSFIPKSKQERWVELANCCVEE